MPFWKIVGLIAGVCAAPLTGGTSLMASAALCGGIGLVAGHLIDQDEEKKRKENQQLALAGKAGEAIRGQVNNIQDQRNKEVQETEELVKELQKHKTKLNDPNSTPEEKDLAKRTIPILQSQLDDKEKKVKDLDKKIDDLLKNIPGTSNQKGQGIDLNKVLIIGGAGLVIYLLLKSDKER